MIAEAGHEILQTKYAYLVAYAIAIYDHSLTFDVEVEHIWKRKFSGVTALFFLTRYYFLFAFTLSLFMSVVPIVGTLTCERMMLFTAIGTATVFTSLPNCVVALRLYAMYNRRSTPATALFLFVLAEIGVSLWLSLTPTMTRIDVFSPLGHPELNDVPAMRFCLGGRSPKLTGIKTTTSQIMQFIFDTVALLMVLVQCRRSGAGGLANFIAKQGLIYYILNVAMYTAWATMQVFAPAGSKFVMAGPTVGMACVSVNRLTLHLRSYTSDSDTGRTEQTLTPIIMNGPARRRQRRDSWMGVSTLEAFDTQVDSDGG